MLENAFQRQFMQVTIDSIRDDWRDGLGLSAGAEQRESWYSFGVRKPANGFVFLDLSKFGEVCFGN